MRISNKQLSLSYIILNLLAFLVCILIARQGYDSGLKTARMFYFSFIFTILLILIHLALIFIRPRWWLSNIIWTILPFFIYGYPAYMVAKNLYDRKVREKLDESHFGSIEKNEDLHYLRMAKSYIAQITTDSFSIDTTLYSPNTLKAIFFYSYKDTSYEGNTPAYKNREIFACRRSTDSDWVFDDLNGGYLTSENQSRDSLNYEVVNWYLTHFAYNSRNERYLWNYNHFWKNCP